MWESEVRLVTGNTGYFWQECVLHVSFQFKSEKNRGDLLYDEV